MEGQPVSFFKRIQLVFQPFSRAALFRVLLLVFPLVAMTISFKLLKLFKFSSTVSLDKGLVLLRWDFMFLFFYAFIFIIWLDRTTGWLRKLGLLALHGSVLFLMILGSIEHSFFTITGTIGDWYLFKYTLLRIGMLREMLQSQLSLKNTFLVTLPILLNLLPILLEKIKPLWRWLHKGNPLGKTGSLYVGMIGILLLTSFVTFPKIKLKGDEVALVPNVYLKIFGDIRRDLTHQRKKKQGPKGPLLFDNQALKLVPNRSFKKMNVVVVVLESTRAHSVTPYQPKLPTTPFLNQLSKKSLMAEWMYPVIPHTSKALVSILCGIPPKITMPILESEIKGLPGKCLPNLFKPLGYQTAFFQTATWHFERRFQLTENMGYQFFRSNEGLPRKGFEKTHYFGYPDKMMIKPSMEWVEKQQKAKKPFFLTYLTLTSHHHYAIPKNFKKLNLIKNPKGKQKVLLNKYLNSLRYTDDFVRELIGAFKKKGLLDNTLFVFVGDHGEAFYEHKRWQHDNGLWEEILRVPSFIYNPKLFPKARKIKGLRQQIDIVPTIADALGLDIRGGHLPGISMLKKAPEDRKLHYSCWYKKYCLAVRQKNMKYIYNYGRIEGEVYDLSKDPLEKKNLVHQKEHADILKKHQKSLLAWRDHVNGIYESPSRMLELISKKKPKMQVQLDVRFGDLLKLEGYNLHTEQVEEGKRIDFTLFFKALKPIPKGWNIFYHGHFKKGKKFINLRHKPLAGAYPLSSWKTNEYIADRFRYRLSPKIPGNNLMYIRIGMWKGKKRQEIHGAYGRPSQKKSVLIAEIKILKSKKLEPKKEVKKKILRPKKKQPKAPESMPTTRKLQ